MLAWKVSVGSASARSVWPVITSLARTPHHDRAGNVIMEVTLSLCKATICTGCIAGSTTPVVAAVSSSVCKVCDAGRWSQGNVSACRGMPALKVPSNRVFSAPTLTTAFTQNV